MIKESCVVCGWPCDTPFTKRTPEQRYEEWGNYCKAHYAPKIHIKGTQTLKPVEYTPLAKDEPAYFDFSSTGLIV